MIYALLDKKASNDNEGWCQMTALAAMNTFIAQLITFREFPKIQQLTGEELLDCMIATFELTRDEVFNERV